jgi:hypothetical protein
VTCQAEAQTTRNLASYCLSPHGAGMLWSPQSGEATLLQARKRLFRYMFCCRGFQLAKTLRSHLLNKCAKLRMHLSGSSKRMFCCQDWSCSLYTMYCHGAQCHPANICKTTRLVKTLLDVPCTMPVLCHVCVAPYAAPSIAHDVP